MTDEIRIMRAMRDSAAFRIAVAYIDEGKPYAEDVQLFKIYRAKHSRMVEEKASGGK